MERICSDIERLFQPEVFDPASSDAYFVVAAPDYLAFLLSKALLPRLPEEAPGVRVRFVDPPTNLPELLHDSTIDLAVCGTFGTWPDLTYQHLFHERFVAAVARDHPLGGKSRVTSADLLEYPGVNYNTSVSTPKQEAKVLTGVPSLDWVSQLYLGQFTDAVLLAIESPIVARAPESLVRYMSTFLPLTSVQLSGEADEVDTGMFWTQVQDEGPEQRWLRAIVEESLAPLASARPAEARD